MTTTTSSSYGLNIGVMSTEPGDRSVRRDPAEGDSRRTDAGILAAGTLGEVIPAGRPQTLVPPDTPFYRMWVPRVGLEAATQFHSFFLRLGVAVGIL